MGARLYCSGKQFSTKVQAFLIALLNSLALASQHILFFLFLFLSVSYVTLFAPGAGESGVGGEVINLLRTAISVRRSKSVFLFVLDISTSPVIVVILELPSEVKSFKFFNGIFHFFPFFLYFFPGFGRRKIFMSRHVDRTVWRVVH
jgi:hypothetical protein